MANTMTLHETMLILEKVEEDAWNTLLEGTESFVYDLTLVTLIEKCQTMIDKYASKD
jgi:hypothetical protein